MRIEVLQRSGPVEVESEAGVARQRAVRRRAWFRHRLDTSIASASGRWTMMLLKMSFSLSRQVVESTAAGVLHVAGWRGSRSYGCGRSRAAAGGAGSGAGTPRPPES